ncbi:MAG TPA: LacI family DNA-binding transcriptional regulator [Bacillales bacterium]|nr:LacI family DNA-binding transcriptional regulator [Bacillales bacterium]
MNPTIKDVAKKAKVSTATVSRILNDLPGYSAKTKEKVLQAIEELGYQPNAVARGLIMKKTRTIGVLFPDVSNSFASEILNGIEDACNEMGHSVIVCNTASNGIRTKKYLQVLNEKRVDGIIYTSEMMKDEYHDIIQKMNVPVMLLSSVSYKHQLPYVRVDDRHAVYNGTEYLIKKGHEKIGMISGPKTDLIAGLPRVEGFQSALKENGLAHGEPLVEYADGFGFKDGVVALPKLLRKNKDLTAVVIASDEMAVGAISAAYRMGVKIPEQLSIIGYDNLPVSEMSIPPLTTIEQPLYEMGSKSAELLLKMIQTGEGVESVIMRHHIVERESVRAR